MECNIEKEVIVLTKDEKKNWNNQIVAILNEQFSKKKNSENNEKIFLQAYKITKEQYDLSLPFIFYVLVDNSLNQTYGFVYDYRDLFQNGCFNFENEFTFLPFIPFEKIDKNASNKLLDSEGYLRFILEEKYFLTITEKLSSKPIFRISSSDMSMSVISDSTKINQYLQKFNIQFNKSIPKKIVEKQILSVVPEISKENIEKIISQFEENLKSLDLYNENNFPRKDYIEMIKKFKEKDFTDDQILSFLLSNFFQSFIKK